MGRIFVSVFFGLLFLFVCFSVYLIFSVVTKDDVADVKEENTTLIAEKEKELEEKLAEQQKEIDEKASEKRVADKKQKDEIEAAESEERYRTCLASEGWSQSDIDQILENKKNKSGKTVDCGI